MVSSYNGHLLNKRKQLFFSIFGACHVSGVRTQEVLKPFHPLISSLQDSVSLWSLLFSFAGNCLLTQGTPVRARVLLCFWQCLTWKPGSFLHKLPKGRLLHLWKELNDILIQNVLQKIIRDRQIKTAITSYISAWLSSKATNVGEDVEKRECLYTVGGNANWYGYYGKEYGGSSKS